MAQNTSGKSLDVKFGVLGGGSVSGETGKNILAQLQSIAKDISTHHAPEVKFSIDTKAMEQQFDTLATSFATKLQTAISNISVTPGSGRGGGSNKGGSNKNGVDWASLGFTDESQARAQVARIQAIFETVTGDKAKTTIEWKDKNSKLIIKNVNGIHSAVVDLGKALAASDQQLAQMFTGTGKLNLGNLQSVYEKQFASLGSRVTDYLNKGMIDPVYADSLTQKLAVAETDFKEFFAGNTSDANTFIAALNEVTQKLDVVNQRISQNRGSASFDKSFAKAQDFYNRHADFIQGMPQLDEAWKKHLAAIASGNGTLDDLNRRTAELTKNTLAAGAGADVLGSRLKQMFRQAIEFGAVSLIMNRLRQSFRDMYQSVVDINSEMTQLQIVTGATGAEMERRFDSAAASAKRIGIAMTDLINSQTVYARLGYNMDDSGILAEYTAMLSKVGDIDVADAQSAVTSIVKAFDINTSEIEGVMDRMIVVGNRFPIGVDELAKGMMNAGSMLQVAGNSYVESLALLTAANTTVQDISKASTGLRTIAARIRDNKSELDALGELDVEFSYSEIVQAATDAGVALTDTNGELRSTYDIIKDLAVVWDDLSSAEQAALTKALAGTRQQNVFSSLIEQFQEASGAVEAAAGADGAMSEAYDKWLDSLEGHLGQIEAKFNSLSRNFMHSGLVEFFLDLASGALSVADALAKWDVLLPGVLGALAGFNDVGLIDFSLDGATSPIFDTLKVLTDKGSLSDGQLGGIIKLFSDTPQDVQQIVESIQGFNEIPFGPMSEESTAFMESIQLSNPELSQYFTSIGQGQASLQGYTQHLVRTRLQTVALEVATTALNAAISMGLSAIISFAVRGIQYAIHYTENLIEAGNEARETITSLAETTQKSANDARSLGREYAALASGVNQVTGENISLTDEEYNEFLSISNQLADILPSLVGYYDANGNAILNLSGGFEAINEQIERAIENLYELSRIEIEKNMPDLFKGALAEASEIRREATRLQEFYDKLSSELTNDERSLLKSTYGDLFERYGISEDSWRQVSGFGANEVMTYRIDVDDIEWNSFSERIMSDIDAIEGHAKSAFNNVSQGISSWLLSRWDFAVKDEDAQKFLQNIIAQVDWSNVKVTNYLGNELPIATFEQAQEWISDNILSLNDEQIAIALDIQTQINSGAVSLGEINASIDEYIAGLGEIPPEVETVIRLILGGELPTQDEVQELANEIALKTGRGRGFGRAVIAEDLMNLSPEDYAAIAHFWGEFKNVGEDVLAGMSVAEILAEAQANAPQQTPAETTMAQFGGMRESTAPFIDALNAVSSGTFSDSDMLDFLEEYPEFMNVAAEGTDAFTEALEARIAKEVAATEATVEDAEAYEYLSELLEEEHSSTTLDNLREQDEAIAGILKDVVDNGEITRKTLGEIEDLYPDLAEAANQYRMGLITESELLDQVKGQYINNAHEWAMQELMKQDLTGMSNQQIFNMYSGLMSSLGVVYSGNASNFAAMLTNMLKNNASAVSQISKAWNALYSAFNKYGNSQTSAALSMRVIAERYLESETPEGRELYSKYMNLYYAMKEAGNLFSGFESLPTDWGYTPVGGGSGGSGGGGGGGSSSSKEDPIREKYESTLSALQARADWYQWQAENAEEMFKHDVAATNWREVIKIYQQMASAAQKEMDRLKKKGLTFGDDEYDDAVSDFQDATDAIKDIYADLFDAILEQYEDYIDAMDDFNLFGGDNKYQLQLIQEMLDRVEDAYANDLITTEKYVEDKLDILGEYYDTYEDYIDAVGDAIDKAIEKENEALEQRQEELEETQDRYRTMIDIVSELIDKQIDALDEENDQLERQVQLEEALQALEDAKRNKTVNVYREGIGFVWEADAEAVKEAQEAYDKLLEETATDEATKKLEAVKEALQNIANEYENNKNAGITAGILGDDWESRWSDALSAIVAGGAEGDAALDTLLEDIKKYTDAYGETSKDLDEDVEGSIASQIEALDKLSDAWSDFADSLEDESSQYEGLLEYIKEFEAASYEERLAMISKFSDDAVDALEAIRAKADETANSMEHVAGDTLSELLAKEEQKKPTSSSGGGSSSKSSGTSSTEWNDLPGLSYVYYGSSYAKVKRLQQALVAAGYASYLGSAGVDGQFGPKTYAAVRAFQKAAGIGVDGIAGKKTLNALLKKLRGYAQGGVIDYTGLAMVHGGSRPEIALSNADAAKLYEYIHNTPNLLGDLISRTMSIIKNTSYISKAFNNGGNTISINIGDLYEVQNAEQLAREISTRLPNLLLQKQHA